MAGTKLGGQKAAATNRAKYGKPDSNAGKRTAPKGN